MAPRGLKMALVTLVGVFMMATAVVSAKSNVIELTSESFEHLTQAASGATTGDWLIEFYAPWCGHCKRLEPVYEKVAGELKGKVNVAKVDTTEHYDLGKRFEIKGFPTIVLFRQGKMYKHSGPRTAEELSRFARSGYKTVEAVPVPSQQNIFTELERHLETVYEDFVALLATKKNVLLVTFSGGLLVGLLLGALCSCFTARAPCAPVAASPKPKTN